MCTPDCLVFAEQQLTADRVAGRRVLEVGARDVNGSARPLAQRHRPAEYVGVDIVDGPGVDALCDVGSLAERFGEARFDLVVCTEVLEHVRDWRRGVENLKRVLAPGGVLVATTRSRGFHYHGYPLDFWRYEPEDIEALMADMSLEVLLRDPGGPGVFFVARKPADFRPVPLDEIELFSIITGRRCRTVGDAQVRWFLWLKRPVVRFVQKNYRSLRKRMP
ncbi:MAG: class I SAM-dependent methyltransferase [Thermoguttaceae bacterium]